MKSCQSSHNMHKNVEMSSSPEFMPLPQYVLDIIKSERMRLKCSSIDEMEESNNSTKGVILVTNNDYNNNDDDVDVDDRASINSNANVKSSKAPRLKFTAEQRSLAIGIYDNYDCKREAMRKINEMKGFEALRSRRINHWKTSNFRMGRPISDQFEEEVIKEHQSNRSDHVASCAERVKRRGYWDDEQQTFIQKWLLNKHTCQLKFTNRWVSAFRERAKKRILTEIPHP